MGGAGIELDKEAFVGFRAYLEKETKVGPFWSELLYDRVIRYSRKRQSNETMAIEPISIACLS